MPETISHRPLARRPFLAVCVTLVLAAATLVMVAGCGGSKQSEPPAERVISDTLPVVPPAAETTAARPPADVPITADLGAKVFATRCALCHGPEGHGDGVGSKALNPKPRNFHDVAYMKTRTDAQLLEVIHKGKGAMPRWQGVLSEAEIAAALAHVRALGNHP